MGKKLKMKSNASLAAPHAAGTPAYISQPSLHKVYGVIDICWPRFWTFYYEDAFVALEGMREIDQRVLALPVDPSQSRIITDTALIKDLFLTGTRLVTNVNLAFEHLAGEIAQAIYLEGVNEDLKERLNQIAEAIGFGEIPGSSMYERFSELREIRHALMHPNPKNIYSLDNWAKVPLAWMVSDKCLETGQACIHLLEAFGKHWEAKQKEFARPGTLTASERGIQSLYPVKLPPHRNH